MQGATGLQFYYFTADQKVESATGLQFHYVIANP